jgi:uncharacterized protein YndB with AHSA1/START domain
LIRQYFFGTNVQSDWKPGSDLRWHGEWQGKAYEDKGKVIAAEPGQFLHYTYWSSMTGKEDKPESYANVKNTLREQNGETILTVTQDGIANEEGKKQSEENWRTVLEGLKTLVEQNETVKS